MTDKAFNGLTPETIGVVIANVEKAVTMLKMFAALTPTNVDDVALDGVTKVLSIIKPYAAEPWFVHLLDMLFSYLRINGSPEVKAAVDKLLSK